MSVRLITGDCVVVDVVGLLWLLPRPSQDVKARRVDSKEKMQKTATKAFVSFFKIVSPLICAAERIRLPRLVIAAHPLGSVYVPIQKVVYVVVVDALSFGG